MASANGMIFRLIIRLLEIFFNCLINMHQQLIIMIYSPITLSLLSSVVIKKYFRFYDCIFEVLSPLLEAHM